MFKRDESKYKERLTPSQLEAYNLFAKIRDIVRAHEEYQYRTDLNKANEILRKIASLYNICNMWFCRDEPEIRALTANRFFTIIEEEKVCYLDGFACKPNSSADIHKATKARRDAFDELFKKLLIVMHSMSYLSNYEFDEVFKHCIH